MIHRLAAAVLISVWALTPAISHGKPLQMTLAARCSGGHVATGLTSPRYDDRHPLRTPSYTFILSASPITAGTFSLDQKTIVKAEYCAGADACEEAESAVVNVRSVQRKKIAGDLSVSFPSGIRMTQGFVAVPYVVEDMPCN